MGSVEYQASGGVVELEVDVLISGAGPTGAALACFLGSHGIKGLMISDAPCASDTPRANYSNMAAFECLRDIGLEERARELAHSIHEYSTYNRICKTLNGQEILRAYTFGNDPHRRGDYADASPCETACLPQDKLEPLLLQNAAQNGFATRFDTKLLSFSQDDKRGVVESILRDQVTGQEMTVRSKFLCGADGAQSTVARQLALPMQAQPGGGLAINMLVEADMSHLMDTVPGLLHYLTRPDRPRPPWAIIGLAHFIKPWNEWVISLVCRPDVQKVEVSEDEMMARARELIGDDGIDMKLKRVNVWKTEEVYAHRFSEGNVFCLGDAVHRHPPFGGLGSNTCIQDAFNLAWKMAYVLKGRAGRGLLATYNDERQPVGKYVVGRANANGRLNLALYSTIGIFDDSGEDIDAIFAEDSERGEERRVAFRKAVRELDAERHGLGAEMNQWYQSRGVCVEDEVTEPDWAQTEHERAVRHVEGSYPGFRTPHAWLRIPKTLPGPERALISTRDLCGHGRFTILTGIGGKAAWKGAAGYASAQTGVEIEVFSIGFGQDYEDPLFSWFDKRGVGEKGAVLIRPDRAVAWRSATLPSGQSECEEKLTRVMRSVLALDA